MTDAVVLLALVAAALAFGTWVGRRNALARHHCPPPIQLADLFKVQEREWERRGSTDVTVHNTRGGVAEGLDAARQIHRPGGIR